MPIRRVVIQNDINVPVAHGVAGLKEDSTVLLSQIGGVLIWRVTRSRGPHVARSCRSRPDKAEAAVQRPGSEHGVGWRSGRPC